MSLKELKTFVYKIVEEADTWKVAKHLQLDDWCHSFENLFHDWRCDCEQCAVQCSDNQMTIEHILEVLSKCWVKPNKLLEINLNRRKAAKDIFNHQNWRGSINDIDRYQFACWCCLEEDIEVMYENFNQNRIALKESVKSRYKALQPNDVNIELLKTLVKLLSGKGQNDDNMMEFWSHKVSGYTSGLELNGRHIYVYGLHCALDHPKKRVEAIEFFWNKIKDLPEKELGKPEKDRIFMDTTFRATRVDFEDYPEVFKFCYGQMKSKHFHELLKREYAARSENPRYGSLDILLKALCYYEFQTLFDCLIPGLVSFGQYSTWLKCIARNDFLKGFKYTGQMLFDHLWGRNGFDSHRNDVLKIQISKDASSTDVTDDDLLIIFFYKDWMKPVYNILDAASFDQRKMYTESTQAEYIRSRLPKGELKNFLEYCPKSKRT